MWGQEDARLKTWMILMLAAVIAAPSSAEDDKKPEHPAVNAGRPTITDPAALTAPGWLETEIGVQSTLNQTHQLLTPILLKLTSGNNRLQFRLANDGYNRQQDGAGGHIDGVGDTYGALQYLVAKQSARVWDMSVRGTVKFPSASGRRGVGSGKTDYGFLRLAKQDFTSALHLDVNLGNTALGRPSLEVSITRHLHRSQRRSPSRNRNGDIRMKSSGSAPFLGWGTS